MRVAVVVADRLVPVVLAVVVLAVAIRQLKA
jgi:hypothetical protein